MAFFLKYTPQKLTGKSCWLKLLLLLSLLAGCSLPPLEQRTKSQAISSTEAAQTQLGKAITPLAAANSGLSGIRALPDSYEAFAIRSLLALAAEKSLDIQYYIWRNDITGLMLLESLLQAADRGVRVRLLLDDNGIKGLDRDLALLHTHPNIEIRLFNPFVLRNSKILGYLTDFQRLNHRMHNKSFTADNMATIVGGRNIGDEYFGATEQMQFTDLDVLAFGPVVQDVSEDFDKYWSSPLAYPINQIVKLKPGESIEQIDLTRLHNQNPERTQAYVSLLQNTDLVQDLLDQTLNVEWAKTEMVSDDPIKAEGKGNTQQMLTYQLSRALGTPSSSIYLISPYFVPTKAGVASFAELLQNPNLQIRVLTNSYEATDVAIVHSGYVKRRKALLKLGIELYELKRLATEQQTKKEKNAFSSSASSLHAKTFMIDQERVFIGSFNFDPRSSNLNTELGFVIHSPNLAMQVSDLFNQQIPYASYRVKLNTDNNPIWLEQNKDNETIIHTEEPGTNVFSRWGINLMSKLPIEWML